MSRAYLEGSSRSLAKNLRTTLTIAAARSAERRSWRTMTRSHASINSSIQTHVKIHSSASASNMSKMVNVKSSLVSTKTGRSRSIPRQSLARPA
jgi:hypothetical protein